MAHTLTALGPLGRNVIGAFKEAKRELAITDTYPSGGERVTAGELSARINAIEQASGEVVVPGSDVVAVACPVIERGNAILARLNTASAG